MTHYTRPELATERQLRRRIFARIGGNACLICRNRIEGWGTATCSLTGRTYPLCNVDGRVLKFEVDGEALDKLMKRAA